MAVTATGTSQTGNIGVSFHFYNKKLLECAAPKMPLAQFAQTVTVPLNSGEVAVFTKLMQLAPVTSALDETTAASAVQVYSSQISTTVARWGKAIGVSTLLDDTFINKPTTAYSEILGINAGESMNLELGKTLLGASTTDDKAGVIALVYDSSQLSTNNISGTATAAGSTTSLIDTTGLAAITADLVKGGWISFTNPQEQNFGISRKILALDATSDIVWWTTAIPVATSTSTTYRIGHFGHASSSTTTGGSDIYCMAAVVRATSLLEKNFAMTFPDGYWRGTLCPDSEAHFLTETSVGTWVSRHQYADQTNLLDGEIGRFHGVRYSRDNKPYRISDAAGFPYSATGAIFADFILGRDSLGRCGLSGQTDTQFIVKRPGPQTTSDPTNNFCTASWVTTFARLSLNACSAVAIITEPTQN